MYLAYQPKLVPPGHSFRHSIQKHRCNQLYLQAVYFGHQGTYDPIKHPEQSQAPMKAQLFNWDFFFLALT